MLDLSTDEGNESERVFYFNGQDSKVAIPNKLSPKNLTASFAVSFWMKHRPRMGGDKEYVLASSDSEGKEREYLSVSDATEVLSL